MSYTYGMKGAPATGKGAPGLPVRADVGLIRRFFDAPGPDWLLCDGTSVSIANYPALASSLGVSSPYQSNWTHVTPASIVGNFVPDEVAIGQGDVAVIVNGSGTTNTRIAITSDYGKTWSNTFTGSSIQLGSIATDKKGVWVLVGTNGSVSQIRRSTNDCASLTTITNPISNSNFNSVATDGDGTWIAVGTSGGAIRSTDNGLTWSDISTAMGYGTSNIESIKFAGGVWIAAGGTTTASGGRRSTNRGVSWSTVFANSYAPVYSADGVYWLGTPSILFASSDAGVTWVQRTSIPAVSTPRAFDSRGLFTVAVGLLTSTADSVAFSFDGGRTWPSACNINPLAETSVQDRRGVGIFSNGQIIAAGGEYISISPEPTGLVLPALPPSSDGLKHYIKAR